MELTYIHTNKVRENINNKMARTSLPLRQVQEKNLSSGLVNDMSFKYIGKGIMRGSNEGEARGVQILLQNSNFLNYIIILPKICLGPTPLPHANSITFVTQHPSPGQIFLDPRMGINKINHG